MLLSRGGGGRGAGASAAGPRLQTWSDELRARRVDQPGGAAGCEGVSAAPLLLRPFWAKSEVRGSTGKWWPAGDAPPSTRPGRPSSKLSAALRLSSSCAGPGSLPLPELDVARGGVAGPFFESAVLSAGIQSSWGVASSLPLSSL